MIWAFLGAGLIGTSLGLMGSGGSILTVPVLRFLLGQEEKVAIAGSLGIVGLISLVASLPYARKRLVEFRSVLWFGVPGMLGAYLGAGLSQYVSGAAQLSVFAVLMLVASGFMLKPMPEVSPEVERRAVAKIVADGLVVGIITGFVGVGGGFLIVPALVILGGLSMHRAIGTSLMIIALKSATGFYKYLDVLDAANLELDWQVIGIFAGVGVLGSFVGSAISGRLPQQALRRAFAGFLLVVSVFIGIKVWPDLRSRDSSNPAPSEAPAESHGTADAAG